MKTISKLMNPKFFVLLELGDLKYFVTVVF